MNAWGENWGTDLVSAAAAIAAGYLFTSWQKAASNPLVPLIGEGVVGAGAIGVKHLFRNNYLHEVGEAIGYGAMFGVGAWVAEATTTIGGKGPGAPPVFLPGSSSSKSASAARAAAARAAALAAAGRVVAPVTVQAPVAAPGYGGYDANFEAA